MVASGISVAITAARGEGLQSTQAVSLYERQNDWRAGRRQNSGGRISGVPSPGRRRRGTGGARSDQSAGPY